LEDPLGRGAKREAEQGLLAAALTPDTVRIEAGTATMRMGVKASMANHFGTMQGGLHVGLADLALRTAAAGVAPGTPESLDISVSYYRPINIAKESSLILRGSVERAGRRIVAASCPVESEAGVLLAGGHGTFSALTD
jgi:uncharacterized protein (TIGR00369 family)